MTVLWALLAMLALALMPVIVKVLRREKRVEPPQSWARTSPWAGERADREIADRLRAEVDEAVAGRGPRDYQDEIDAIEAWSKSRRRPK